MKYISRRYLRQKWDSLKFDMENIVEIYGDKDEVTEEIANRVRYNVKDMCNAILKELGE